MKRVIVYAGLLAVFATALVVASAAAGTDRPMMLKDSGSATVAGGAFPVLETADTATGEGTHIGRYTMVAGEDVKNIRRSSQRRAQTAAPILAPFTAGSADVGRQVLIRRDEF
jgi:hypothetical protein